jgi:Rad3-related DNA helicase
MNDFHIPNIKGRGNYTCAISPNFKADVAPCITKTDLVEKCRMEGICPYYNALDKAMGSKGFITSYSYFTSAVNWGALKKTDDRDTTRQLLISDEAHEMEQIIADFISIDVSVNKLKELGVKLPTGYAFEDINSKDDKDNILKLKGLISDRYNELAALLERSMTNSFKWAGNDYSKVEKRQADQINEVNKKVNSLRSVNHGFSFYLKNQHINWMVHSDRTARTLRIAPLSAGPAFEKFISPMAEKFIFMSASLGDRDTVYRELGFDPKDCVWISVDTPFDPKKSPVVCMPYLDLSKKNFDDNIGDSVDLVSAIMEEHSTDKGIIHSGNYTIAKYVLENTPNHIRRRLIGKASSKGGLTNIDMIEAHKERKDASVLISPSMISGVDLQGDLSKFQIIVKLPWANMGDPWVKAKSDNDPNWYMNDMIRRLVQACGRSTRTETDEANTYIVDRSIKWVWNRNRNMFPKWFRQRVVFGE